MSRFLSHTGNGRRTLHTFLVLADSAVAWLAASGHPEVDVWSSRKLTPAREDGRRLTAAQRITLARYVLVEAENAVDARRRGQEALLELEGNRPFTIRTFRPANVDEIDLMCWDEQLIAEERA